MTKAPTRYSTLTAARHTASTIGRSLGVRAIIETTVGIMPPIAKPMFHERPVPDARGSVVSDNYGMRDVEAPLEV
ncbi:hypothetical protein BSFA1_14200 [Burkholderia sp. SFA1]|nr:hypothetical protein BSFA1_14200 [Burkholderia sp. SFA1]